ncbi:MAG: CBS domain-containing protein, partial [Nodosilinea sp.]
MTNQVNELALNPGSPRPLWRLGTAPITVPTAATLLDVIKHLGDGATQGHSCVLVVEGSRLVGLVTDRDVIRLIAGGIALTAPIHQHITKALTVQSVSQDIKPLDVLELMQQGQIRHLPLVDDSQRPVRLITAISLQQVLLPPHVLKLQPVQSRMNTNLITASPTDSAVAVAALLAEHSVGCVAVLDPETCGLVGQVLRQDVLRCQARQLDLGQLSVQTIMRDAQFCLQPSDSLWLAYQEMNQQHLPCLLVVAPEGQTLGVITQSDLLFHLDRQDLHTSFSNLWQALKSSDGEQLALWKNHSSELERLVQGRTEQLQEQAKCDRILTTLTQRIHESLDLQDILSTTVTEVRQLLKADRTLIYKFDAETQRTVVVESVMPPWRSILGQTIEDSGFVNSSAEAYNYEHVQAIEDIEQAGFGPDHVALLQTLQIRAKLVMPIVYNDRPWGLLVINQCAQPRRWRNWEIRLIERLARSVAIALRQSEFYRQLQADLE